MLGNGWTVDVIAHILGHAPGITTEPVEVLSMYDGMSCGHIALNKIGAAITKYYATEIDKYAIQTTQHNFPDTIQLGDAFQVRDDGWKIESEGPREAVAAPAVIGRPEELPGPAAGVSNAVIKYPGAERDWIRNIMKAATITDIPVLLKDSAELRAVWGDDLIQDFPPELQPMPEDNSIPHCKECDQAEVEAQGKRGEKITCRATRQHARGRYTRSSPPWCPKRRKDNAE